MVDSGSLEMDGIKERSSCQSSLLEVVSIPGNPRVSNGLQIHLMSNMQVWVLEGP
jgi:hypothetical protein